MKHLFLVTAIILSITVNGQNDIKGYALGEKHPEVILNVSLANITGAIAVGSLNDGTAYYLMWMPGGDDVERISNDEFTYLKEGIEKKYQLKFTRYEVESFEYDYIYRVEKGNIRYALFYGNNPYMSPTVQTGFALVDLTLESMYEKEQKARASSDF